MKIIITKNYEEMSEKSARFIIDQVKANPKSVLGLATGSTPIGLYKNLIAACDNKEISFADVTTVNLDEYIGLDADHNQSYRYFMNNQLFNHIDINKDNTYLPSGIGSDMTKVESDYTATLAKNIQDIQLLGLGGNGHIGFNEPGTPFTSTTHIVNLKSETLAANARFFAGINEVPTQAITMGIKNVMDAKCILLVASGTEKAKAVQQMVKGEVSENCPASILQQHNNVIVVIDEAAASLL